LFPDKETLAKDPTTPNGPFAGAFRTHVRDQLNSHPTGFAAKAVFSEEWEIHGHARENPGLYEPLQFEMAALVVMLLPGTRSLAVNTWELALALESSVKGKAVQHLEKLVLLLPETVYRYMREVLMAGAEDPKDFKMYEVTGKPEPALGAANSFAARWLCLAIQQQYGGADAWSKIQHSMAVAFYKDQGSWQIGDSECKATVGKLLSLVEQRLSVVA
jgi:hypothetical protein